MSSYQLGEIAALFGTEPSTAAPASTPLFSQPLTRTERPDQAADAAYLRDLEEKERAPVGKKKQRKRKKEDQSLAPEDAQATGKELEDAKVAAAALPEDDAGSDTGENATKRAKTGEADKEERTIFVGNIPGTMSVKQIGKAFQKYGAIDSIRLRSAAVAGTKVSDAGDQSVVRKACMNQNKLALDVKDTVNAYVVFSTVGAATSALSENGAEVGGKHLRVDGVKPVRDPKRSVFLGNLPYNASDERVRRHFAARLKGGDAAIEGVRLIRDKETLVGKGFGYLLLRDHATVAEALRLHETPLDPEESAGGATDAAGVAAAASAPSSSKGAHPGSKRLIRVLVCGKRTKDRGGAPAPSDYEGRRAASGAARRVAAKKTSPGAAAAAPKGAAFRGRGSSGGGRGSSGGGSGRAGRGRGGRGSRGGR